jgi:hypothetical protein
MICEKFKFTASAYIDRHLTQSEADQYRAHLYMCADCRAHLTETREASSLLRSIARPEPPSELHSYVVTAIERRSAKDYSLAEMAYDWVLKLNPQPVSYMAGVMISAVMFALMLFALKPIQVIGSDAPIVSEEVIAEQVLSSGEEFCALNDLPAEAQPEEWLMPRMLKNTGLVSFSLVAYDEAGPETMAAIVEVKSDGRAELIEVLGESSEAKKVEQLWWSLALSRRTFQPAFVNGKPVSTRIVLLVEKVDVRG